MEEYPITARSLEKHYHIDGDQFERQYKEHLSGYRDWAQKGHAEEWMVFEENIGEQLSIDETSLSNGELYTIIENKAAHGGKGTIVAMVKGTKAENVISPDCRTVDKRGRPARSTLFDYRPFSRLML